MNAHFHISHLRAGAVTLAVAFTAAAAPSFAMATTTLYASPNPSGTHDCDSVANACSIYSAVGGAAAGDQVVLEPGDYGSPGTPLTTTVDSDQANVDIHGTDTGSGAPSAVIYSVASYGLWIGGFGSELSDVEVNDTGSSNGAALAVEGSMTQRVVAISGPTEDWGCTANEDAELRDTVCEQQGTGIALGINGVLAGPNDVTLRNDTAVSTGGIGIYVASAGTRTSQASITNTIVWGGVHGISAYGGGSSVAVTTSHSNYTTTYVQNGATITDDGTSQASPSETVSQLFVDAGTGDLREVPGAETIGAGEVGPADGDTDYYGDPRTTGDGGHCTTVDIGADEFSPPASPAVSTEVVGVVTNTTADLEGASNAEGGTQAVRFEYGAAGAHGVAPKKFESTAVQCLPAGDTPALVSAPATGLLPGTKYYYRLVAVNGAGTTIPGGMQTFWTTGSPEPQLTKVSESHRRWAEHGPARPIGTTFRYMLNEPATVRFTIGQVRKGSKNVLVDGAVVVKSAKGMNRWRFRGLIGRGRHGVSLAPGRYTVLVTATNAAGAHSATVRLESTVLVG